MPSFDGEAFTRPMLKPFFVGSDEIGRSSTIAVSEPTDFESWIMLFGFFFCNKKFITSFSRSVFGCTGDYCVASLPLGI